MNDKTVVVISFLMRALRDDMESADRARRISVADANEADGKMISRYDTFKEEAQFLAGGHAKRAFFLHKVIEEVSALQYAKHNTALKVVLGSIVHLSSAGVEAGKFIFLVPDGAGGKQIQIGPICVFTVSVSTPIAAGCINKEVGDECVFSGRKWTIKTIE